MENIVVFPLVKRVAGAEEEEKKQAIESLAYQYMTQIIGHLDHHGFEPDEQMMLDMELAHEAIASALYRSIGLYHPLQDLSDKSNVKFARVDEDDVKRPSQHRKSAKKAVI